MTAPGNLDTSPSSVAGSPGRELPWPRRARCERCLDEILKAKLDIHAPGRPMILEVAEVLPAYPCDRCKGTGTVGSKHGRRECGRCHGTRHLGERIPDGEVFVAINSYGIARTVTLGERVTGEALHRTHRCRGPRDEERPLDVVLLDLMD